VISPPYSAAAAAELARDARENGHDARDPVPSRACAPPPSPPSSSPSRAAPGPPATRPPPASAASNAPAPAPAAAPPALRSAPHRGDQFGPCFGCDEADSDASTTSDVATAAATTAPSSTSTSAADTTDTTDTTGTTDATDATGTTDAPNDPPLPAPDRFEIVQQVAAEHPDWLKNSCVEDGGTNDFLFEVARRLRQQDDRWGLNWKRGVVGDLSQDVVDYHYGEGEREESTDVHIIDMIVGHCGDDPQPGWLDVTQATLDANTVGKWTLAGQDL
jgi:hypothetical protein